MASPCEAETEDPLDAKVAERAAEFAAQLTTVEGCWWALEQSRRFLFWMNDGMFMPYDVAMFDRIESLLRSGEELTEPDKVFLIHECVEDSLLRDYQPDPHNSLRRLLGDFANYAPNVVQEFAPMYFNEAWLDHWGLQ